MEGFYIQNRAWFMFDETFQKTYCNFGLDYVTGNPNLPMTMNLTKSMIINARTHLYGSIQISTRKAITVHKYLKRYKTHIRWYTCMGSRLCNMDHRHPQYHCQWSTRIPNTIWKETWIHAWYLSLHNLPFLGSNPLLRSPTTHFQIPRNCPDDSSELLKT